MFFTHCLYNIQFITLLGLIELKPISLVSPTRKAQYFTFLIHHELYSYYHYYTIASPDWLRCLPTLILLNGYRVLLSPKIKQQGCEAGQLSPSNANIKNKWSYISTPTCASIMCTGTVLPSRLVLLL